MSDVSIWVIVSIVFWAGAVLWIAGTDALAPRWLEVLWIIVKRFALIVSGVALYLALTGMSFEAFSKRNKS